MTSAIKIRDLTFSYETEAVLKKVSLNINDGDFAVLIGSNGSGKTTLIKLILGLLQADSGKIYFYDREITTGMKFTEVGYVPQLIGYRGHFPITVEELMGLAFYDELNGFKRLKEEHIARLEDGLKMVDLEDKKDELFVNLSGGQKQRVLIAKALIGLPRVLILDEPTSGIDYDTRKSLFKLLEHLNEEHKITILMITHELYQVEDIINRLFILQDGKVKEGSNHHGSIKI